MREYGESAMSFNFDFDASDFFGVSVKAPEKKEIKKAASKAAKPAASGKGKKTAKAKDCDVSLPVTIIGRNMTYVVEGTGTKKATEILKELATPLETARFGLFCISGVGVVYDPELSILYVDDSSVRADSIDSAIYFEEENVYVCDGDTQVVFKAEDFPDKEADEIAISDVKERFTLSMPEYSEIKGLFYSVADNVCYPVMEEVMGSIPESMKDEDTLTVVVGGVEKSVPNGELKDVIASVAGTPSVVTPKLYRMGDKLYLSYANSKGDKIVLDAASTVATPKKKVETKYPLPLDLFIVTWNVHYQLTPEMFDGAEKVTTNQITEKMAEQEKMFADKSRKPDYLYSKDKNMLSCMFISGTKGAPSVGLWKFVHTEQELKKCMASDGYCGIYCEEPDSFKFLTQPIGTFIGYFGKEYEACNVVRMDFQSKIPKIPRFVLNNIIEYFKTDLSVEMVVRILYNKNTGEFTTVAAKGSRTKHSINYDFSDIVDAIHTSGISTVMEIHSHNTMPAYFSDVDDRDEGIVPGLYGVIGSLDKEPEIKIRASFAEQFKYFDVDELFG